MSPVQRSVLDAIRDLTARGVGPSLSEIGEVVGITAKSRVHRIVAELVAEGYVVKNTAHGARNIRVVHDEPAYTAEQLSELSGEALQKLANDALSILHTRYEGRAA